MFRLHDSTWDVAIDNLTKGEIEEKQNSLKDKQMKLQEKKQDTSFGPLWGYVIKYCHLSSITVYDHCLQSTSNHYKADSTVFVLFAG